MWLWLLLSCGVGALLYILLGELSYGEPVWLRIIWGITAGCAMLFIGKVPYR